MLSGGSFLPSLSSLKNYSLLGSKEPTLLCNHLKQCFTLTVCGLTRHVPLVKDDNGPGPSRRSSADFYREATDGESF